AWARSPRARRPIACRPGSRPPARRRWCSRCEARAMTELGWGDWTFIGILAVAIIVGPGRGRGLEVLSLLGWVAASIGAQWLAPDAARHIPVGRPGSALNHAAAFACVFIVVLIVWALLARLLSFVIHASPLSPVDRVLGATFGLARALVVMLAIATV